MFLTLRLKHVDISPQVLAFLLAAAVHDLAHPGLTNDFLARSGHALAARHNRGSGGGGVNERHHIASFLSLLDDPATDAFAGLSEADQRQVGGHIAKLPPSPTLVAVCFEPIGRLLRCPHDSHAINPVISQSSRHPSHVLPKPWDISRNVPHCFKTRVQIWDARSRRRGSL